MAGCGDTHLEPQHLSGRQENRFLKICMGALPAVCPCTTHTQSPGKDIGLTVWSCHMNVGDQTGSSVNSQCSLPLSLSPAPGPTYHKYTLPPVMLPIEGKHSDRSIYTLRAVYTVPVIFAASQLAMQSLSFPLGCFFPPSI